MSTPMWVTNLPSEPPAKRRERRWRAATAGSLLAGLALVAAAIPAAGPGAVDAPSWAAQASDTLRTGDLRCLTRRPVDCLETPVPPSEPHEAVCATCHNLWRGEARSVRSCTDAACHAAPASLSPFHRTVAAEVLADCTACHKPHAFRVAEGGSDCGVCHRAGGVQITEPAPSHTGGAAERLGFTHERHTSLRCVSCHGARTAHATFAVDGLGDCRSCHHERADEESCLACHALDEVLAVSFSVTRALEITIGSLDHPERTLLFEHASHWTHGCTTCHTGGSALDAATGADCSSCHFQHHDPDATCSTCHERPAEGAHDRQAHLACGGAGCHDPVPPGLAPTPRTRNLCLACHTDRAEHQPEKTCSECHRLPPPLGVAGGA